MRRASPGAAAAWVDIEVRYAETDQMGVVHHANYLVWFELARTRLCADAGMPYAEIEKRGYLLMVTGAELRYRSSAHYGERVRVTSRVARIGSRGVGFAYEVLRGDDLLATGATEHLWIDAATRRPCSTPADLRIAFSRLAAEPTEGLS